MRYTSVIPLLIASISCLGQNFQYEAEVDNIKQDGFYKIFISPEISSNLNTDFYDIRLYSDKKEIPYILQQELATNEKDLFREYSIIDKKHFGVRGYTRIVIHNPSRTEIDNIVLRIKNADVRKRLKLNASLNNKDWYVLKDNYYYNSIYNTDQTSEIRVLNFPLSDYEYYELLIDDFFDKPINIIQAGFYDHIKEYGKYTELKDINYTKQDTLKETVLSIPLNHNFTDKIDFEITSPRYYYREAQIYLKRKSSHKKGGIYKEVIGNINLISNSSNSFLLQSIQADSIFVRIQNHDNEPLEISDIRLLQLNKYLTAELSPKKLYTLKFSDKEAEIPTYDLRFFTDSIPADLEIIKTKSPKKLKLGSGEDLNNTNLNFKNYWLWLSILIIAILLSYMSFKMIKENNKD